MRVMAFPAVHEGRLDVDMGLGKGGIFKVMAFTAQCLNRLSEQGRLR